jgi:hypothetical protein
VEQIAEKCVPPVTDPVTIGQAKAKLAATYATARAGAEHPRPSDLTIVQWATTARECPMSSRVATTVVDGTIVTPESQ